MTDDQEAQSDDAGIAEVGDSGDGSILPPSIRQMMVRAAGSSGPLPPPEWMKRYEEVLPGSSERIFVLAEGEASHRRGIEGGSLQLAREEMAAHQKSVAEGRRYAMFAVVLLVGLAAYALHLGAFTVAGVIAGTTIVALALAFIAGTRRTERPAGDDGEEE